MQAQGRRERGWSKREVPSLRAALRRTDAGGRGDRPRLQRELGIDPRQQLFPVQLGVTEIVAPVETGSYLAIRPTVAHAGRQRSRWRLPRVLCAWRLRRSGLRGCDVSSRGGSEQPPTEDHGAESEPGPAEREAPDHI